MHGHSFPEQVHRHLTGIGGWPLGPLYGPSHRCASTRAGRPEGGCRAALCFSRGMAVGCGSCAPYRGSFTISGLAGSAGCLPGSPCCGTASGCSMRWGGTAIAGCALRTTGTASTGCSPEVTGFCKGVLHPCRGNSQRWLCPLKWSPGALRGESLHRLSPELLERLCLRGVGPGFPSQGRTTNLVCPRGLKTIREVDGFGTGIRG